MTSPSQRNPEVFIRRMYRTLARVWGRQHWWPAETSFEVIVGAILTQNTSWKNVELALESLRLAGVLSLEGIRNVPLQSLQGLIRSSGYYRQKAERLKGFVSFVDAKYGGSLDRMFVTPTQQLRSELLTQKGIGHETADAILLYAGNHEIFVVDAYARRVLERHGAVEAHAAYNDIRTLMERALAHEQPLDLPINDAAQMLPVVVHKPSPASTATRSLQAQVLNEMHGLLVQVGKHYCRKQEPRCEICPLQPLLPDNKTLRA